MVCCSCGLRQSPRAGYCVQCDCPLGALAPPPGLDHRPLRPQRLAPAPLGPPAESLARAGLLAALLGWLAPPLALLGAAAAVVLASAALRRARRGRGARALRLSWAALVIGGACAAPGLAALAAP